MHSRQFEEDSNNDMKATGWTILFLGFAVLSGAVLTYFFGGDNQSVEKDAYEKYKSTTSVQYVQPGYQR